LLRERIRESLEPVTSGSRTVDLKFLEEIICPFMFDASMVPLVLANPGPVVVTYTGDNHARWLRTVIDQLGYQEIAGFEPPIEERDAQPSCVRVDRGTIDRLYRAVFGVPRPGVGS
jgi:hypothetical protein